MADLRIPGNWFVPDTTVDGMYRHLVEKLATMKKLRLERPSPETLVIHHQSSPGWTWVKTTETASIMGADVDGGARFTATGQTSGNALVAIYRAFGFPGYGHEPPPPTSPDVVESPLDRVQDLANLRDRGVLTHEEFETAKARILDEYVAEEQLRENRQTEEA